ncbi:hypothetical protein L593_12675 [Salinarchaeum sp. Harcht-Bsk1]|nr:hypothetical protein L593_12675 [Salinarchaeum sp. Harcht-Bsk1]
MLDGERGRSFDLRDREITAEDVSAAIRTESAPIDLRCAERGPIHERVGVVEPDRTYPLQAALAAVARERGLEASQGSELAEVRARLAALELPTVSLAEQRRRIADTDDAASLEEQVSTLRGQLEAARERGEDHEALAEARERAVAELAERRTERIAAEQSLDRARRSAREARDRREDRLELEDRERNLERAARRELAGELQAAFDRALDALPGDATAGESPGSVEGPAAIGALAVCRVARIRAPVVVAGDWFDAATAAAAALDAPVVLVDA